MNHDSYPRNDPIDCPKAPSIDASHWINTTGSLSLENLRGKVIALHAFQMLCPGCVTHGLPQASAIDSLYSNDEVQVIGLHSVFEHHNVMTIDALKAFVHEYRLAFPIAVDQPSNGSPIPVTMQKYQLQGTPSLVLIDQAGRIRLNHFGRLSDMQVGNLIGQLLAENQHASTLGATSNQATENTGNCNQEGCKL